MTQCWAILVPAMDIRSPIACSAVTVAGHPTDVRGVH
jgi:hypothetical protein